MEELVDSLGFFAVFDSGKVLDRYVAHSIHMISDDLDETSFMSQFTDIQRVDTDKGKQFQSVNGYLMYSQDDYHIYQPKSMNEPYRFIFKNGKLKSIKLSREYYTRTLNGIGAGNNKKQQVLDDFGPIGVSKIDQYDTLTYNYDNKYILFQLSGDWVTDIYYIPK